MHACVGVLASGNVLVCGGISHVQSEMPKTSSYMNNKKTQTQLGKEIYNIYHIRIETLMQCQLQIKKEG